MKIIIFLLFILFILYYQNENKKIYGGNYSKYNIHIFTKKDNSKLYSLLSEIENIDLNKSQKTFLKDKLYKLYPIEKKEKILYHLNKKFNNTKMTNEEINYINYIFKNYELRLKILLIITLLKDFTNGIRITKTYKDYLINIIPELYISDKNFLEKYNLNREEIIDSLNKNNIVSTTLINIIKILYEELYTINNTQTYDNLNKNTTRKIDEEFNENLFENLPKPQSKKYKEEPEEYLFENLPEPKSEFRKKNQQLEIENIENIKYDKKKMYIQKLEIENSKLKNENNQMKSINKALENQKNILLNQNNKLSMDLTIEQIMDSIQGDTPEEQIRYLARQLANYKINNS